MSEKYFNMDKKLITVAEMYEYLHVHRGMLMKLVKSGMIPHILIGRRIRFVPDEIERWLRRNRIPKNESIA